MICHSLSSGVSLWCLILCWERVCSLLVSLPDCSWLVTAISSPFSAWDCSWGHTGLYLTWNFCIHVHRWNPVFSQDSGAVENLGDFKLHLGVFFCHHRPPAPRIWGKRGWAPQALLELCVHLSPMFAEHLEQPKLLGPGTGPSPLVGCGWLGPGGQAKCCQNKTELKWFFSSPFGLLGNLFPFTIKHGP